MRWLHYGPDPSTVHRPHPDHAHDRTPCGQTVDGPWSHLENGQPDPPDSRRCQTCY